MPDAPPDAAPAPAPEAAPVEACPRCGARVAPRQEYCLECGLRLPSARGVVPALGRAWRRRLPWYPGDWIWPSLLGLAIAAAGAALAILTSDGGASTTGVTTTLVATTAPVERPATTPVAPLPTTTVTATRQPPATRPTTTRGGRAPVPQPQPKPKPRPGPQAKPKPAAPRLADWPAGRSGYTVVLASLPTTDGLAAARAKADAALKAGLRDVGVLESSKYSSLHPGYYVVFSGVYGSFEEAQRAAGLASDRYRAAYARQIAP